MADVVVKTAELELRTAKLTKSILKQMPTMDYKTLKPFLGEKGHINDGVVIGWINGSVLGEDWDRYLILKTGEGTYGKYKCSQDTSERYSQIYIV